MQTEINFVDYVQLQKNINNTFGENVFTVIVDKTVEKKFFLEYEDTLPQTMIDQAIMLASENSADFLKRSKLKLYPKLQIWVEERLKEYLVPNYTQDDYIKITEWLNDQSLSTPNCVLFYALEKNLSNVAAAEEILTAKNNYDAFVGRLDQLKQEGETVILTATDIIDCKLAITSIAEQIKNLT